MSAKVVIPCAVDIEEAKMAVVESLSRDEALELISLIDETASDMDFSLDAIRAIYRICSADMTKKEHQSFLAELDAIERGE